MSKHAVVIQHDHASRPSHTETVVVEGNRIEAIRAVHEQMENTQHAAGHTQHIVTDYPVRDGRGR